MWGLWMLLLAILFHFLLLLAAVLVFILALFIAHVGYFHLVSASSRWCYSDFNSSLLEQMVFALCCSEPTTLYLDETVWLLSHWRYRSMCVGFLYTVVLRFPSPSGIISTSRNLWNHHHLLLHLWTGCAHLYYLDVPGNLSSGMTAGWWMCHPQIFSRKGGMWCCIDGLVFKLLHIKVCHNGTYRRSHGSTFLLFIKPALENETCACKAVLQQSGDVLHRQGCSFVELWIFF